MPECQLPGIAYGASMVVGKSSGNAVRLLSGMLINTCFRPQPVFRVFSEAATREAVQLWNQTDGQFVQLGQCRRSGVPRAMAALHKTPDKHTSAR